MNNSRGRSDRPSDRRSSGKHNRPPGRGQDPRAAPRDSQRAPDPEIHASLAPPKNDEPIMLELTGFAHGGSSVGRHEGRAVFVPYTIPGEVVTARIVEDKGRFARAELVRVENPSLDRVIPRCPYFGPDKCGGCQLQHMSYPAQLAAKTAIVRDQLTRIGGVADARVLDILPSPDPWNYRTHVTFHATEEGQLGFVTADDQFIIPVDECHIIQPALVDLLQAFNSTMLDSDNGTDTERSNAVTGDEQRTDAFENIPPEEMIEFGGQLDRVRMQVGSDPKDRLIAFSTKDNGVPSMTVDLPVSLVFLPQQIIMDQDEPQTLVGEKIVIYDVRGKRFQVTAGGFFQANSGATEHLIDLVLRYSALTGSETVLDLYSGVGLFTAFLSDHAGQVLSVESYGLAVRDAEINLTGYRNVELALGTVEDALPQIEEVFDVVVLDPPRAGMEVEASDALIAKNPARIVYVSCDVATFARDTKRLLAKGYSLVEVQPVDMFPQTASIELVALFVRG